MTVILRVCITACALNLASFANAETLQFGIPERMDKPTAAFVDAFVNSRFIEDADVQINTVTLDLTPKEIRDSLHSQSIDIALFDLSSLIDIESDLDFSYSTLLTAPLLVGSSDSLFAVQESVYGDMVAAEVGRIGLVALAYWNRPERTLISKRDIETLDDFKGLKVSVRDEFSSSIILGLGAIPVRHPHK